jgi:hypothetical protein
MGTAYRSTKLKQCRLVHDRDIRHELAHCIQTLL